MNVGIVYHSRDGHTAVLAEHISIGVQNYGGIAHSMLHNNVDFEKLEKCDAIIFGCPTYMGSVSAELKSFMDNASDAYKSRKWKNKIAAGFTNSAALSGDKLSTLMQIMLFAMQHGMIWVGLDLAAGQVSSKNAGQELNRIGTWLGLATQSNVDEDSTKAPPESDRKTAEYFGQRICEITKKFK